ncbi:hypothetical protein AtubIFM57143_005158 [Aspergillus tubingensis]|nr:hypothetical protein AtubIFM57143_005158 [Aspergillus tubingensis]
MQRIGYGFGLGLEAPTLNHDLRIQWLRSRWPRLTSEAEGWKLEQQWAVKEGVVIAHSRMHNKSNCDYISTSLAKDLGFRIRELDFISRDCPFNDDDNDDQRYAEGAGPGGYGFVKIHEFPSKGLGAYRHKARRTEANDAEQPCQPDGVTVVVGFFVNGEPWTIDRIETEDIQIKPRGYTDLVVGYRLALISKQADNLALLTLTAKDLDINEYFSRTIGEGITSFAFRFLVEVAENIPKDHGLRNRIRDACLGHLRWVLLKAEVREGKYARNYWISGRIMPPSIRLLNDGPTDTPFQILKAYEYHRVFDQTNNGSDVIDLLSEAGSGEGFAVVKWLQQLEQEDARNGCVWSHGRRVGMDYYRLDDQAWIWGSLKALSTMLKWNAETRKEGIYRLARRYSQNGRMEYNQEEMTRLQQKYDPERVRQEVFNRFPATNPNINGGKMFALTRSPQESRFEFHSRDTALFYQLGGHLFLDDMNAPWERTLNAQKLFPSKRDTESDNSLRYGLRLLMAVKGFSTNTLHQPAEALEEAQKFIKAGVLTNGLFSNNINDSSEAVPHDYYRDRNLHIPFEMLYIIWSTRDKVTPQKMHATMKDITTRQTIVMSRTPFNNRLDERSLVLLKGEWGWSPKYNDQELLRASASFRFLGDIFDHYWTCQFFESYFNVHIEPMTKYLSPLSQDLKAFFLDCGDSMWQKRRILEQLLFYRVLTEVNMSTSEICEAIHTDLQQAMQDLDKLTPNEYFKSHRVWISWNEVLDTLTEDLNNIYEMIKEWRVREENRRGNQPRWTKRHEIKYREAVQRSLLLGESAVRDFKVCQTRVASLKKSVTSHREITTAIYNQQMDDRNFRQNDNIKYFTYSTVFFLPLSFATSFFSMQAKPTGDLIRQMIVCTIVAFVILLVILITLPSAVKEIRNSSQSARTTWKALRRQTGSNNVLHSLHRSLTRYTGGSDNGQNLSEARSGVSDEESGEMVSSGETFNNDTK